jgi:GGDEF domain-containing protein
VLGRQDSQAALPRDGASSPQEASVAILVDPIDLLQDINRKYGCDVGDRVLDALLRRLSEAEPSAVVARFEEDAFSMTMTASMDHASAAELASHLGKVVRQPIPGAAVFEAGGELRLL